MTFKYAGFEIVTYPLRLLNHSHYDQLGTGPLENPHQEQYVYFNPVLLTWSVAHTWGVIKQFGRWMTG
jgi:hypothetical protein